MRAKATDYLELFVFNFRFVIAGIVVGLTVGGVLYLLIFLLTRDVRTSTAWLVLTTMLGVLFGLLRGISEAIRGVKNQRRLERFIGRHSCSITPYIERSRDNSRQFRMTPADAPNLRTSHYHLERLANSGHTITESSLWGEPHQIPLSNGTSPPMLLSMVEPPADTRTVAHYIGFPPSQGQLDTRVLLPPPRYLILHEESGGVFLLRLTEKGEFAGDTWHATHSEAREQVAYEYGEHVSGWRPVPKGIDSVAELLEWAHTLNSSN